MFGSDRQTYLIRFFTVLLAQGRAGPSGGLAERGVFRRMGYQPVDRYWTFQAIEAAIFAGLAAVFALFTLWRVRTHDA